VIRHTFVRRSLFSILVALAVAAVWPSELLAQRAVPRPSGRRPVVVARPYYYYPYYSPRYYWPYYYGGFYAPFYWGGWGPYPYGYPYYYGQYYYDDTGAARLQVSPRNAQVYVDGYFAGVVDNFDGTLQRLNVESGEHELQFHLEGYRPYSLKVLFVRGRTLKITHAMEPLGPGEPQPTPPKPDPSTRPQQQYGAGRSAQMPPGRQGRPSDFGSLLLRVRPSDATVMVDGEPWTAPQG
jgi:PEGA domain